MKQVFSIGHLLLLTLIVVFQTTKADGFLKDGFKNPPASAKSCTWWHWINGNVTREGITADLEAMKEVGIQEAQIFNVSLGEPKGSAAYLSDAWLELLKFAATEAQRLGLELTFHNGPGWSSSGGPWITPKYAMQKLVYSELIVSGGRKIEVQLPKPKVILNYYKDIAVLAFPNPLSNERIKDLDIKILEGKIRNHLSPNDNKIPVTAIVRKSDIVDLTSKLDEDGKLHWQAPEGEWVVLRVGHTAIGTKNRFASYGGKGLECDKMSSKAVDVFWRGGISPIIEKLDTLIGTVVKGCLIDSYEVGTSNWTAGFEEEFKRLRSYDCFSYLPTLAGYYVESLEVSERFLWDFRRTIGDLISENYYGHFSDLCHKNNLRFFVEPYWGPFDNMQVGATGDMVMCEFWSGNLAFFDSPKFVASIAKLNGNSIVGSEAFTGMGGWQQHPAMLKSIGDLAWAQGINRFIFHSYVHQPWHVPPGLTLGPFGIDFNRHNTWWNQGKAFLDYIARSQFLLQQGSTVADVLVFTGEASPNNALLFPEIKAMGYDYDLIGSNKLGTLSVKDGLIYTTNGDKYQMLVFPESEWLTPVTLKIIEKLVKAGGIILGAKPQKSPSLKSYPKCDQQVAELANRLWGATLIKNESIIDKLKNGKLPPDFKVENGKGKGIAFIHRKAPNADIYFVANSIKERRKVNCKFRISGLQPELWNAETGEVTKAVVWKDNGDGTTSVPIKFEAEEAVFVIFREPASKKEHIVESHVQLHKTNVIPLPDLKIIKAEYGTFLSQGLVDVTEVLQKKVKKDKLIIEANRSLCNGDPAPGYHKELRVEYCLDGKTNHVEVMEKEMLKIEAEGQLEIKKAIFGKFAGGVYGLPADVHSIDITESVSTIVKSGKVDIYVDENLLNGKTIENGNNRLHITYSSHGQVFDKYVEQGRTLKLSQESPKSTISYIKATKNWVTPTAGKMSYRTTSGKSKSVNVKSVPDVLELTGSWNVYIPSKKDGPINTTFSELKSWSLYEDNRIRHFSGTTSYRKEFMLSKELLNSKTSLELDLGSVQIIAEVLVNGKNLGILWKSPFRINLDGYVHEGVNSLEVKVTNRWTNRLIGDEQNPSDIKRQGPKVKQWPEWLQNPEQRLTERLTFAAFKHWNKDDELQSSGLLGPVIIRPYRIKKVK
ncbi:glycosyl hydrolase [Saccharicrinis sp. GN24d3]|uniref:glycosyl hydrolase n=1 Tax=Saccharicrinis sp. GN24d3 TaxID=3458416 RepID=UPI0040355C84